MPTTDTRSPRVRAKDPNTTANRGANFVDLLPDGVTLASAVIAASSPEGLAAAGSVTVSGTRATGQFTGGTAGQDYAVTFRGTYSDGQTEDVTIIIPVRST